MTTQKVQSKIKTSTIAITVLSILLAVAVASTIVLAAFSASKNATVTIQFGNSLTLTITGEDVKDGGADKTDFSISKSGLAVTSVNETDYLIKSVSATANQNAFIAYGVKPTVSGTGFSLGTASTDTAGKVVWTITKGSATATLTIWYDNTKIAATSDTNGVIFASSAEVAADTAFVMFNGITVQGNVNDLAGLTINGLTTTVKAATLDASGDYSTNAGVIAEVKAALAS